ncbi:hypothetical protein AKJ09_02287 [Labilithrix luteola]|uniref:Uncharacterized protein n=1 Tax=Labilithrix luteola TaxID=1391654 RepID=A0A0K1PQ18_9BACT|nr:hypothetical protein [Labilithrix luteola]AKU95623.1 hypothetical protein AKJ09_02287 [Labilithrix luteola]
MIFSVLVRYATLFTVAMAIFSASFAVFSFRRRTNAAIYLDLSDRLQKLYRAVPTTSRAAYLVGKEPGGVPSEIAAVEVLDFLHLMHSAFTLHATGYFSGRLWVAFRTEAERGLRLPVVQASWPLLREEFQSSPGFVNHVERALVRSVTRSVFDGRQSPPSLAGDGWPASGVTARLATDAASY